MMLSDVCLSDVCRVHPVSGRHVWPAGWMTRIGWSGPARPTWLNAAAARFRCRPGRGHIVAAARPPTACCSWCYYGAMHTGQRCGSYLGTRRWNVALKTCRLDSHQWLFAVR